MESVSYRIYFGDRAATETELEHIEEITVDQAMDQAWEARIRLFLCMDEHGHWQHTSDEFPAPFSRVRIELKLGDNDFVPLIDGPVASYHTAMDSQPGRSHVNLVVRDDSVLLNREEAVHVFENHLDEDVARMIFDQFPEIIATVRIDSTDSFQRVAVRRSTPIQFLRKLAHAHSFHAYVLPGEQRGESIGCFLADPENPGTLPPFVLMGADRNLADIEVSEDPESPQRTTAHTLRLDDQQVSSSESSTENLTLLRDLPPLSENDSALRQLPPEQNDREDVSTRTTAATRRASYAYKLSARMVPGCYPAVLMPYQKVSVHAGNTPYSGAYLLTKVTHHITLSLYTQTFEAKSDARSDPTATHDSVAGGVGVSVDFSASLSIF